MEIFNPRVLVVGSGSMGNRRIRNMKSLGINQIAVFDLNPSRLEKFSDQPEIQVFSDFKNAIDTFRPEALVISTPPDKHFEYVDAAIKLGIPSFLEASVEDSEKVAHFAAISSEKQVLVAPSTTMRHFNFAQKIRETLQEGIVGKPLYINYHVGQYLPDWHPWEDIKDFYVSKPSTAACKEIVPFELTWLCELLSDYEPDVLTSVIGKSGNIDAPIDDLYNSVLLSENGCLLNLTIEILSRPAATRKFHLVGATGTITYDALTMTLTVQTANPEKIQSLDMKIKPVEGYIYSDQPYEEEMNHFFTAILEKQSHLYPNDLTRDAKVLNLLKIIEDKAIKIG